MAEDRDGPMSTIDYENPRSGWSAECHDCPYTIEPNYGARVWPRSESGDRGGVERWAAQHVERFPGHRPAIDAFTRWTMTITEQITPAVFVRLWLPGDDERPDPVAELLDTVRRVKNIVWQNFGIEPSPSPYRALPAGAIDVPRTDWAPA
ncbi:hypothetical protein BI023_gp53 [Mycobacterium phage Sneeze]|uniref:Uncharacterized protein n=1 Tax=Mycobacterium phage Rabbs TaxID=2530143 RepID=A0A481VSZ5_9CAUD|nr:hypothetical protein BI023_gp53 [Mycobacterium phage Sneeze]YP_010051399.1 hypothetical protein KDW71_gp54 [Mycobacterium phage Rabbs]ANU79771.1 hypothetical protein SEA_SNEEZE_53 [Mycobacterium phage Sneeze]QBI96805.1 hypothetical protein SEA_RABBS_54 [Mycobacterium phage Rabbs]